jgi:hypothetical protein
MKSILPAVALALTLAATPVLAQTVPPAPAEKGQAQKAKSDKAKAGERANKGGAQGGEERAGAVKEMNKAKKAN